MVKFIFGMQINIEVFYKVIIRLWVCTAMHAQITQNKKFVYLYNVYRKMLEMIFFLPADKHKSFLQVDSINCGVRSQACPKNPK